MSDPARPAERQQARQQGLIAGLITFPIRLFGVLCGSLLLSVVIACLCMHFFWPQQRWHHAEHMLQFELDQLSTYFTQSLLVQQPARVAHRVVEWTYEHVFVKTRMLDREHEASARNHVDASSAAGLKRLLGIAYVNVETYVIAAGYTLLTFLVRLVVLCLTFPLFCVAWLVGIIDGLARRDIRRFGAGRESGFLYHRARASIMPLAVLPWVVYLALPVSVHPLLILLPSAVLLSIAVNIAAGSFKKYL